MSEGILASFFWDLNKLFDVWATKSSWTEVQHCIQELEEVRFGSKAEVKPFASMSSCTRKRTADKLKQIGKGQKPDID
jgi:hypothetical protein